MKKLFFTAFLLVVPFLMSYSQVKEGNNFEIGGIYAFAFSRANDGSNYNISGPGAYFEYRYEYDSQFYVGGRFDYRFANGPGHQYTAEGIRYSTNYNQFCLKGLGGYTFCPERVVSPFVGIGVGGGFLYTHRMDNNNYIYCSAVLTPRVGAQIWRFRLSCDLDLFCGRYGYTSNRWSVYSISRMGYRIYTTVVTLNLGFRF